MSDVKLNQWITLIRRESEKLKQIPRIMEICGTHTLTIHRYGIKDALQDVVEFISGPGCPVCVTPRELIDNALTCAARGQTIAIFGDMMRVPGSRLNLLQARSEGADIRVVTSPMEVLELAESLRPQKVTFLAVGFETTAPGTGLLLEEMLSRGRANITLLIAHRRIPPALYALLADDPIHLTALLGPGHVAAIIGSEPFERISREFRIPCVISGFEPEEILISIVLLLRQIQKGGYDTEVQYRAGVRPSGNPKARAILAKYFQVNHAAWRGLGMLPMSGLFLRDEYQKFNENLNFEDHGHSVRDHSECHCGEILRGVISPVRCPAFASSCTPDNPLGPCMVSFEGACRAAYLYERE